MNTAIIEVNQISKKFGRIKVLNSLNINCHGGEVIALIGPNGSGKTTLIKCILGMVIPTSGTISIYNRDIANAYLYRENIGYMPQIGRYPDNMTMGQVFESIKRIRTSKKILDTELIVNYHLELMLNKSMRALSGGTTQKVSAALAFLFNPEILILDEPTAGLDPLSSEILKEKIIKERNNGKLVLITSHHLSDLDELVTQVIFMNEGRVQFHKTIQELMNETSEIKLSKAIAKILKYKHSE